MPLASYRRKRDFQTTPEPPGQPGTLHSTPIFAVQKHDASRLHYDLRLEIDGVLRSWAVPKGPSLNPSDRRLAVEVEDHPLEYAAFEGIIPNGQYGGGTVMLWDRGTWEHAGDPAAAYREGSIKFTLHGEKLRGAWTLVRMQDSTPGLKSNWLLIKKKDQFAAACGASDITLDATLSVSSGRDLQQVAAGAPVRRAAPANATASRIDTQGTPRKTHRNALIRPRTASTHGHETIDLPKGAHAVPMLHQVRPQLCTLADHVPEGAQWRHEVKFDGYRLLAFIHSGMVRLVTRSGLDWTHRFPELATCLQSIPTDNAVLDGEVLSLNTDGLSDFQSLQAALKNRTTTKLVYLVFDLLYVQSHDLRVCTLDERYAALQALLQRSSDPALRSRVRLSAHIGGNGQVVMKHACRLRLEGIVSKRSDSTYEGARSSSWIKIKCGERQEFVVGGYSDPKNVRSGFGSLLLGYHDHTQNLVYAGKVGAGFDERELKDLGPQLKAIERSRSPFNPALDRADALGAHWVEPKLVAEVAFTQWTRDGRLRHPVYHGLRHDKDAGMVVRERPISLPRAEHARRAASRSKPPSALTHTRDQTQHPQEKPGNLVLGITITHPERIVYPKTSITKLDVARYYAAVAEWMTPHTGNRPLSLVRCPRGAGGACFFNKHLSTAGLNGLEQVSIRERKGVRQYVVVHEPAGLVSLAQMNTLEFHTWGSTADDIEHPDQLVFDLDPGEQVHWRDLVQAARRVRAILATVNLQSFVKTSGGKGLHVVSPLLPKAGWDDVKAFGLAIASVMQEMWPHQYIATMSKTKRRGKVFIDYLRNQRGGTAVAPYSTRAREGATVSMPVRWDELARLKTTAFTIRTVPALLRARAIDPWKGFNAARTSPLPDRAPPS